MRDNRRNKTWQKQESYNNKIKYIGQLGYKERQDMKLGWTKTHSYTSSEKAKREWHNMEEKVRTTDKQLASHNPKRQKK